jgi:hypothetical protein
MLTAEAAFDAKESGVAQHLLPCITYVADTAAKCTLHLQVRLLAAEAAYDAGESGVAQHLLLGLAAAGYPPAWRLAAEMACPERCVT